MAHALFQLPKVAPVTSGAVIYPGAKLYFYQTGTSTPQDTYSDSGLTTPNANPVVADANGLFGTIYLDPSLQYKATLKTSADVLLYTVDPANDQLLTQDYIGQLFYPRTTGEISAGVTPTYYFYQPGDVRRYGGGVGVSAATNRLAWQNAIDANDTVYATQAGDYEVNAAINLKSNLTILATVGARLVLSNSITTEYILRGATVSKVRVLDLQIVGNGLAGVSNVYLTSCTDVLFDRCASRKAGSIGIWSVGGTNIRAVYCDLSDNYFYGVEDRDGVGNRWIGNRCQANGTTGAASSAFGRGIVLWRCVDCVIEFNRFALNTEYGCRIYSEVADSTYSYGNRICYNYFEDNTRSDIVLYDESLAGLRVFKNIIAGNIIIRSSNASLGGPFLASGADNDIYDNHIYKTGTFGTDVGINLYYAVRNKVHNCSVTNMHDVLGFSSAVDCDVDAVHGYTVATVAGTAGTYLSSGCSIRNGYYKHGGGGSSDVGIVNYNSSGLNTISGNTLDGFNVGIYIQAEAVRLINNKTLNSGTYGFRKDNDGQAGQELIGNVWDVTNPAMNLYLERKAAGAATLVSSAAPTTRTWAVGDRCWNSAPSSGNPKSWVCTVAGTPGTWVSEGDL